jgi:hypothetical protein
LLLLLLWACGRRGSVVYRDHQAAGDAEGSAFASRLELVMHLFQSLSLYRKNILYCGMIERLFWKVSRLVPIEQGKLPRKQLRERNKPLGLGAETCKN